MRMRTKITIFNCCSNRNWNRNRMTNRNRFCNRVCHRFVIEFLIDFVIVLAIDWWWSRQTKINLSTEGSDTSKIVYEISKSFDFIEITLISGDFTDFIEITLIVKSRKCLHTTSANSDIFVTCICHVSLQECSLEDVWNQLGEARSEASLRDPPSWFYKFSRLTSAFTELVSHVLTWALV